MSSAFHSFAGSALGAFIQSAVDSHSRGAGAVAAGNIWLGGDFAVVGTTTLTGADRFQASYDVDTDSYSTHAQPDPLLIGAASAVLTFLEFGGALYAGTGANTNGSVLKLNSSGDWEFLTGSGSYPDYSVTKLLVHGSQMYALGQRRQPSSAEDAGALYTGDLVMVWDGSSWSTVGASGLPYDCLAGASFGSNLYVLGRDSGGTARFYEWNGSSWSEDGESWSITTRASNIYNRPWCWVDMLVADGRLYITGCDRFVTGVGLNFTHLGYFNGSSWTQHPAISASPAFLACAGALAVVGSDLYVQGSQSSPETMDLWAFGLTSATRTQKAALTTTTSNGRIIHAMTYREDNALMYLGTNRVQTMAGNSVQGFVSWDLGSTWAEPDGGGTPANNSTVAILAASQTYPPGA